MSHLYAWINQSRIKPNLVQTGAIGVQLCFDDRADRLEQLASKASNEFDVQLEKNLTLLTIRHYSREKFEALTNGKRNTIAATIKRTPYRYFTANPNKGAHQSISYSPFLFTEMSGIFLCVSK